jgi:hypothetical protein
MREGFGLPLSKLLPLLGRMRANPDKPSFIRVHRQFELAHSRFATEHPHLAAGAQSVRIGRTARRMLMTAGSGLRTK